MLKRKTGTCVSCGNDKLIYAKKMCPSCYLKSRLKVYNERNTKKMAEGRIIDKDKLNEFFRQYWDSHPDRKCVECNIPLFGYQKWHIHHLVQKRLYKQYLPMDIVYNPKNIVYVCLHCHSKADHNNMKDTPKIKELYNIIKQQLEDGSF